MLLKTSKKCRNFVFKLLNDICRKHDVKNNDVEQARAIFVTRDATRVHVNRPSEVTVHRINILIADLKAKICKHQISKLCLF